MKSPYRFALWFILMTLFSPTLTAQEFGPAPYIVPISTTADASQVPPVQNMIVSPAQVPVGSAPSSDLWWPRPYVYGGLSLSRGAGYSPAAGTVGGGLNIDNTHFIMLAEASVENAHKLDSGTGSEFGVRARSFFRTERGCFFGGGAQWSTLNTIAYAKQAWRPVFGGGKDLIRETFSMRAQVLYVLPGTDRLNALQGPEISLWLPSPSSRSHFFYRQTIGIYEFHQTAVPGNPGTNQRSASSFVDFTAMYRF